MRRRKDGNLAESLCIPPICIHVKIIVRYPRIWIDGVRNVQDPMNGYFRRVLRRSIAKEYDAVVCTGGCRCKRVVNLASRWQTVEFEARQILYPPAGTRHNLEGSYQIRARVKQGICE